MSARDERPERGQGPAWSTGKTVATVASLCCVAAAVRIGVAVSTPFSPLMTDMEEYWVRAVHLYEQGHLFPDSWRMPGLPAALAAAFSAAGSVTLKAARVLNVLAAALSVALTYWLAIRAGLGSRAALAAFIVAVYPSLVLYTSLVSTEAIVIVPLIGVLVAATYESRSAALAMGVLTGIATLVRPATVALLPAAVVTAAMPAAVTPFRSRFGRAAIVCVAFSLTMLPWWIRNYQVHDRFLPLDTTGGLNLLIGSGPRASGRWDWSAVGQLLAKELAGVDVATPSGSDRASAIAWSHATGHPVEWVSLIPAKLTGLFALEGRELAYLYSTGYFGPHGGSTVFCWAAAILTSFAIVMLAAFAGLANAGAMTTRFLVAALTYLASAAGLHVLSFGDPRFHLPFMPVLAVMAAGAAVMPFRVSWPGAIVGAAAVLLLLPVWYAQAANYWRFVQLLMQPGGWDRPVSFDDLL